MGGRVLVLIFIAAFLLLGACTTNKYRTPSIRGPQPTASPDRAAGDHELEWVFGVAEEAGFEVQEVGQGAPTIVRSHSTFQLWAFVPDDDRDRASLLQEEGYERVGVVAGVPLFSDGQRLTWGAHGVYVWLTGVDGMDASTAGVADIVRASTRVTWQEPFRLLVHCGLSYPLEFAGRTWLPVDRHLRRTHNPPDGFGSDENHDEGTIRVVDEDMIVYTSSEGLEVAYEPTEKEPKGCE